MRLNIKRIELPGDLYSPVGLYLNLRDIYPGALLLESADYHDSTNSSSFLCLLPLATIKLQNGSLNTIIHGKEQKLTVKDRESFEIAFDQFIRNFQQEGLKAGDGLYGYISYDAVQYFEDLSLNKRMNAHFAHPDMVFSMFRFVIKLNHFNDTLSITENIPEGETSEISQLINHLNNHRSVAFPFIPSGEIVSNLSDEQFLEMIAIAKNHCRRGDVFQVVLSRRFKTTFKGDDLNVYRALRRINPSPYLFYFDYGSYRIFGSSPESQLRISNGKATLNPIAGTYRRSGDETKDRKLASDLALDPKENAEHAMLVDLARNDLSRNCHNVEVKTYKEIQYFSHVIHLVSKVSGDLKNADDVISAIADTFPAGTLSGAPKHRAMQIIDALEPESRGYYGGAVGFVGFNGDVNMAILIRSFLSKNNTLYFQAGAGIVDASDAQSELQEVNNKLAALKKAIEVATDKNDLTL